MTATLYQAGESAPTPNPGDFILTHGDGFVDWAIRFGQRMRFPKWACVFNHAALVVSPDGDLVEALAHGVTASHLDKYTANEYAYVDSGLGADQRISAAAYGNKMVGTPYGFATIASEILTVLTGARLEFGTKGTVICSGLVAAALVRDEWRADPSHVFPAELALAYDVHLIERKI